MREPIIPLKRPRGRPKSTVEKIKRKPGRPRNPDPETKEAIKDAVVIAINSHHKQPVKGKTSIVNRVTEYGALFNRLNEQRMAEGKPQLKTAMEVLIEAMQSNQIELKDKAKIAERLATFESSRAPIISIEHVQNVNKEEEASADDSLDDFLNALKKV